MNVTYHCPRCQNLARCEVSPTDTSLTCPACEGEIVLPSDAFDDDRLCRCLICPSTDLFIRKDFPQWLGLTIVIVGIVGSSIAWGYTYTIATFAILFATALADVVLYMLVPDALMCYRCEAMYRQVPGMERHGAFNLETHERYRQQVARMAGPTR